MSETLSKQKNDKMSSDDNDSDDEPVLSKIEIDTIEPLLTSNQHQEQQIIDLVEHVKTEIVEDDSHFEHFEFLVESSSQDQLSEQEHWGFFYQNTRIFEKIRTFWKNLKNSLQMSNRS